MNTPGSTTGLFKEVDVTDGIGVAGRCQVTAHISWSINDIRCPVADTAGGVLSAGGSGKLGVVVSVPSSYEGLLVAGTYWSQGTTVSPLYGSKISTPG